MQRGKKMKEMLSVLRTSGIFSGISEEETEKMLHCLEVRPETFQKDEYILRAGDRVEAFGLVITGKVLIIQEDFWGNRNILAAVGAGHCFAETFACSPGAVLNVSVMAQTNVQVLFLNVKRILTTCPSTCSHHNRMIRNLLSELAEKNLRLNEKITHLGQRSRRAKILSYLSAEAQRHGSAEFDIAFSRQQLADYLSVDRSGLSMELSRMQEEGLLEYRKNHFVLKS